MHDKDNDIKRIINNYRKKCREKMRDPNPNMVKRFEELNKRRHLTLIRGGKDE